MQKPPGHRRLPALCAFSLAFICAFGLGAEGLGESPRLPDAAVLDIYRRTGAFTDPGDYEALYRELPESLEGLCRIIKAQLIHPMADLPLYAGRLPANRVNEDLDFVAVKDMLAALVARNPAGLTMDRKPEARLVVSCRYHAILLASILKTRGVPVRVRYGFASYLFPGRHIYHVVCEVWSEGDKRWILVDPDRQLVDFPRGKFQTGGDAWLSLRSGALNPSLYGVGDWWGAHVVLDVMCHDLASVLGNERTYLERPPVTADTSMNVGAVSADQAAVLDEAAELLRDPDAELARLGALLEENAFLRFAD